MEVKKIVIVTDKEYSKEFEPLLEKLYSEKIELFCVWGKHCQQWEEAMDVYVTDPVRINDEHHITTTSHENEPLDDVINMAECWTVKNGNNKVETIEL